MIAALASFLAVGCSQPEGEGAKAGETAGAASGGKNDAGKGTPGAPDMKVESGATGGAADAGKPAEGDKGAADAGKPAEGTKPAEGSKPAEGDKKEGDKPAEAPKTEEKK